jgi:protein-tyrosine phosphatase
VKATPFWIESPWTGRLAILPRPRGGDWLEDEVQSWRDAGIDVIVSALEPEEKVELDIVREQELCQAHGLEYIPFPIKDRGVPASAREVGDLVQKLESKLTSGKNVGIHCRQGVGRSALLAASLLVAGGLEVSAAFNRIQIARGWSVPDTPEQREWVIRFARELSFWVAKE